MVLTISRYSKPAPLPPAIQTTRRETDDRHGPRSPAVRDSGDDYYKRRRPTSPPSSYGPGTSSYRDERGSRQSSYNSKDGREHKHSGSNYSVSERASHASRSAATPAPPTQGGAEAYSEEDELLRYFKQVDQDSMGVGGTSSKSRR